MYQQNPLLEMSTRQLLKKRKLYTPEQWQSMMKKLRKLGRDKNAAVSGMHSANEYAKRMTAGQIKRMNNLAKKSGRTVNVTRIPEASKSGTKLTSNSDIVRAQQDIGQMKVYHDAASRDLRRRYARGIAQDEIHIPDSKANAAKEVVDHFNNPKAEESIDRMMKKRIISKKDADMYRSMPKSAKGYHKGLATSDIAAHEADEYSILLALKRKYPNLSDDKIQMIAYEMQKGTTSSHMPGVLKREFKRRGDLQAMYGDKAVAPIPRTRKEIAANAKKFNPNWTLSKEMQKELERIETEGNPLTKQQLIDKLQARRQDLHAIINQRDKEDALLKSLIDRSKKVMVQRRNTMKAARNKFGWASKEAKLAEQKYEKSQESMERLVKRLQKKYGVYDSTKAKSMRDAYHKKYDSFRGYEAARRKYNPFEIDTYGLPDDI